MTSMMAEPVSLCVSPMGRGPHIFLEEVSYCVNLLLDPFHPLPSISLPFLVSFSLSVLSLLSGCTF